MAKKDYFYRHYFRYLRKFPTNFELITTKSYYFNYLLIGLITREFIRVCL